MTGLTQGNEQSSNGTCSLGINGFWSSTSDDVSYSKLQKFWSELSPLSRQKLLRIDKQTLFEQARKNMYCSRCNGLLLEDFLQILMYAKSMRQRGVGCARRSNCQAASTQTDDGLWNIVNCYDEIPDPSVHPWGGLMVTRDGSLTLLDCYLYSETLKGLHTVFDSARARERERELLYPDACGGGARGWISQGVASYARVHGTRESCALHTSRLSCDTLVDFWSALGEDTCVSLSRIKEEDFIERLMYRFESKKFCRDCRKNVIREFKELKELKRMRRESRCTNWFCAADTAFQYEVSNDTIQANWCETFADCIELYQYFEWGVGTGEGKTDILAYENVGMNGSVHVNALNLGGFSACFINLRAWKLDGRCSETSVKAHALNGRQCVHRRLIVGDGFVTITRGETIRQFFEHAEEAEDEEDDDSTDNDLDGECSRPQRHAKSPELARQFLLDAATVIFKEQVAKAFREGTARQHSHSIFVSLALNLLEERVHVACKEIVTLEKQMKLLEEEEMEKREEEERRERKRTKERERRMRRREKLKGNEQYQEDSKSPKEEHGDTSNDFVTSALNSNCDHEEEAHNSNGKVKPRTDFLSHSSMKWSSRSLAMQNRQGRLNNIDSHWVKSEPHVCTSRAAKETRSDNAFRRPKSNFSKKVWEPRSSSDSHVSKSTENSELCKTCVRGNEDSPLEVKNCNGGDTTSISDSCHSSPFSSNSETLESSSTSDTDDSNQQIHGSSEHDVIRLPLRDQLNGFSDSYGGLENQVLFAPLSSQYVQYTVFQAPAIGYYPQSGGYLPYSHSNPHVYLGFGNPQLCVSYGSFQLGNPIYHPISQKPPPLYPSPIPDSSSRDRKEESNFSLFHFGGPVGLSTRCLSDLAPLSKSIEKAERDPTCKIFSHLSLIYTVSRFTFVFPLTAKYARFLFYEKDLMVFYQVFYPEN